MKLFARRFPSADPHKVLPKNDIRQIEYNLLKGVVFRNSTLLFVWSFIGSFYGVLSMGVFHQFLPNLTIWENLWPRIICTGIPALVLAFWYRDYQKQVVLKAYLSIVLMPALLIVASLIHAWQIFISGNYDAYLYFHATNIIAMSSAIAIISAPPTFVVLQAIGFLTVYFGPLIFLFRDHKPIFPQLILSDVLMMSVILFVGLRAIYRLRVKLATEDLLRKRQAASFLGESLTRAIFETKEMKAVNRTEYGLILSADIRGYTPFILNLPEELTGPFMDDFHVMVAKHIYANAGFLHKTAGDGLLVSFGIMNPSVDLSDVPGIIVEEKQATEQKEKKYTAAAIRAFSAVVAEFELLLIKHRVPINLVLGAGLSVGKVRVLTRGHEGTRQEQDIDGATIIKAVRLESYSKLLKQNIGNDSSFLIADPVLASRLNADAGFGIWKTETESEKVKDFPDIKFVLYREWGDSRNPESKAS